MPKEKKFVLAGWKACKLPLLEEGKEKSFISLSANLLTFPLSRRNVNQLESGVLTSRGGYLSALNLLTRSPGVIFRTLILESRSIARFGQRFQTGEPEVLIC
jgi:hypothetical protein